MSHLQLRAGELEKLQKHHPDKIPIFITKAPNARGTLPDIRKHKFLVPSHFTFGEVVLTIRKWILIGPEEAIFIFIKNILPSPSMTVGELYQNHKDPDGVLRVVYTSENTFGSTSYSSSSSSLRYEEDQQGMTKE
jgi:GABA(A) receptor-associated protein